MQRSRVGLALIAALALAGVAHAGDGDGDDERKQAEDVNECVHTRAEARYEAYGYTHIAHLHNGCKQAAKCSVWTDVTPKRHEVRLKPGEATSIVTRRGSPAQVFRIEKDCKALSGT